MSKKWRERQWKIQADLMTDKKAHMHKNNGNLSIRNPRFWNAKESGLNTTINWKIINQVIPYKPGQKCYNLCLTEKLEILQAKQPTILNKRSELTGKCRHKNKFKLNKLPT